MQDFSELKNQSVVPPQATVLPEWELENGYRLKVLHRFEEPLFKEWVQDFYYREMGGVDVDQFLSEEERVSKSALEEKLSSPFRIRIGVFFEEKLVGWSFGWQESNATFFMANSGILPEHRRKGLYTQLISKVIEIASSKGFQVISSKHVAVNNAVIIPKLKAGFVVTGMELADDYGTMVILSYYMNESRKHLLNVRAGLERPNDKTKKALF
jgi:ribosomal protein S18 acetylase RimI-like enzyme